MRRPHRSGLAWFWKWTNATPYFCKLWRLHTIEHGTTLPKTMALMLWRSYSSSRSPNQPTINQISFIVIRWPTQLEIKVFVVDSWFVVCILSAHHNLTSWPTNGTMHTTSIRNTSREKSPPDVIASIPLTASFRPTMHVTPYLLMRPRTSLL